MAFQLTDSEGKHLMALVSFSEIRDVEGKVLAAQDPESVQDMARHVQAKRGGKDGEALAMIQD